MSFDISQIIIAVVFTCLLLWRVSYGTKNGLFAEATGLVAVIAAFASVYFAMSIAGSMLTQSFGKVIPRIGYLVVAFAIYRIMTAIGKALRGIDEVPVLSVLNRMLGAVMGAAEAMAIVFLVEFVTEIKIIVPLIGVGNQLWSYLWANIHK